MIVNPNYRHNRTRANLSNWVTKAEWAESIDIRYAEEDGYSLWGSEGIDPNDIFQGQLGNCWFMHAASAIAKRPHRLERVFLNDELSNNGIYGCQLYPLGVPTTVTIDDVIPLDEAGNSPFAKVSEDKALWGVLIEKCFAKLNGNYEAIVAGDPRSSIQVLSGSPSQRYKHTDITAIELFNKIKAADGTNDMISASTPGQDNQNRTATGLAQNHVYTVLDVHEVVNERGQTVRLLRIRNPWGREEYNGFFNDDDSANWDARLRSQVQYLNDNDGTFFIDIATYKAEFESTSIHLDTTNMKHSYYLIQDDTST